MCLRKPGIPTKKVHVHREADVYLIHWIWGGSHLQTKPCEESGKLLMSRYKVDGYCLNSLHPSLSLLIPSKGMSTLFSKSLDPTSLSYWKNLHTCILWYSKLAIGKTWKTHENQVSFCGQNVWRISMSNLPLPPLTTPKASKDHRIPHVSDGASVLEFEISWWFNEPRIWLCSAM